MRIHQLGDGTPEVCVVAGIHGDEPCGVRAVERLLAESPSVQKPVKFVVANERALEAGVRYLDADLNRAFPGDPNADEHERRLAYDLAREVRGCTTLAIHSTQSFGEPFGVVDSVDPVSRDIAPKLPIVALIETDERTEGRLIEYPHVVEVEAGFQASDEAAANAYELTKAFLVATGVLEADPADVAEPPSDVPVFRLRDSIPKPPAEEYEVFATNFERVESGQAFAAADGESVVADEPFYPVLLSPYGYESQFGYAATKSGRVEE
ncbi:MAG: succinylglutamate desuccinylase/aspartoacylase family protein [Haloferacaceae archaeon]